MKIPFNLLSLAAGCIIALAAPTALAVAKFVYLDGNVSVRDAGGVVRLAVRGERINPQETIITGEGHAQLRFDDGGWVSLQPRTIFEVKEYEWRQDGKIVISLLKGAARAVTGLLSDQRRYNFITPVATVGIRGTSFQVTYCVQSCDVPDGLYVTGGDGTVFVRNGFGEIDLSKGRTAFVATAQTPPRESTVKPVAEMQEQMSQQQLAATGATNANELRPGNLVYFQSASGYVPPFRTLAPQTVGLGLAISGSGSAQASGVFNGVAKTQSGSGGPGSASNAGAGKVGSVGSFTVVMDGLNRPVSFTLADSTGRVSGTALGAPEISFSDGGLFWGRWTNVKFQGDAQDRGTNVTGSATLNPNSYVHYIIGIPTAGVPLAGSASYGFMGGSGSTSPAGTVGAGVVSGTLTANFGANNGFGGTGSVGLGMTISHQGTYTASGNGYLQPSNRANFTNTSPIGSINGTASGPTGTSTFKFDGFFAGAGAPTAPARAGLSWQIQGPGIVGTAAFGCKTGC